MQNGPEKLNRVQVLALRDWIHVDTFYNLDGMANYLKSDLAPLVDELGEPVFLVTEISPEFPGGKNSLDDYMQNLLGDLLAKDGEAVQNSLYVKFSVQKEDGKIEEIVPAQPFPDWVPPATAQRCLEAVRNMPNWSPGVYRNRPVKTIMLISFGLRS